jgi:hypothetical protein
MTIDTLINKVDSFELVRDEIAAILATETASQQAMAIGEGFDPALWALKVYVERSNPWEAYLTDAPDLTPLVNVWFDSAGFDMAAGNVVDRQGVAGTFNVDVYGAAVSSENGAGHIAGDEAAARTMQRGVKLCRNILMAATYTYLNLRGIVGRRWIDSVNTFQPQFAERPVVHVVAARLSVAVTYNETSPQVTPEVLELLAADITRADDGMLLSSVQFDYGS